MKKKILFGVFLTAVSILPSLVGAFDVDDYGLPRGTIYDIVENILLWLLAILGIVGIIGFVVSGIMYLISSGDDSLMGKAKNAMVYSIIGVIVGLIGYVVIQAVNNMLSVNGSRF